MSTLLVICEGISSRSDEFFSQRISGAKKHFHGLISSWCRNRTMITDMMTSSNGNIFRVMGPLCGEFTGPRWIPPAQRPVTRSFDVFFYLCRINGWRNNDETGDLRRYRAQYDVSVMFNAFVVQCDVFHCNTKSTETCAVSHLRYNRPLDQQIVYILRSISEMTITCL